MISEFLKGRARGHVRLGGISRITLAAALCVPASLFATAAAAQTDAAPQESGKTEDIIVTAQFRSQNVQSTPIAITALSAQQLEARGQTSITEIATKAPNVNLRESNPQGPSLQAHIRGIGQADFSLAFEPGVGVYVNDVYYSTLTGSVLDLLDLERVEVLRGPQGTLAGMNSIGGAIKLYTKKPDGNDGGFVEATVGSLNRVDVRAAANFTIVPDRLFARISGVSRNQDGYVKVYDFACTHPQLDAVYNIPSQADGRKCQLGTEGGKSYVAARGSLRWVPTEDLEINISGDITRDDSEAAPQTLIFVGTANATSYTPGTTGLNLSRNYPMYSTAPTNGLNLWNPTTGTSPFVPYSPWGVAGDSFTKSPYVNYSTYCDAQPVDGSAPYCFKSQSRVNGWGVSGNIDYSFSDNLKLTSITAYRSFTANWVQDFDATPLSNALIDYEATNWQFSQELRLASSLFDNKVDLVVGGFYINRFGTYRGTINQGLLIFTEYDEIPATNWAAFANASWRITDKLELNGGIRYSEEEKTFRFFRGGRPGVQAGNPAPYFPCTVNGVNYGVVHVAFCGLNGAEGDYKGNNVDWRAVLQYQWTPDIMTYASVATGFKGGGINPRPYTPAQAVPFDPENLKAYEIGFKSRFFDRRAQLNVSAFVNKYSDFIASVFSRVTTAPNAGCPISPNDLTCSYFVNAGKATLKGLEAELSLEPVDNLLIDASAALLDFKYDQLSGCSPALTPTTCTAPSGGLGAGLRYGMTLPYAPKRQISVGAQYKFDIGSAGSITPRLDWSWRSRQQTLTVQNNVLSYLPSYGLLNGRIAWNSADDDWQLALQVTNITNKLYWTGIGPNNNSGTVAANPGMPREWSLSLKRTF
ncbi:TonB-dependent receptor [Sphingobium sp. B11D3D]|uniref:TonB-dependent receptor n=1 Tax=Sphingobium sp. B11D3D TaxID=2940576 RepID=UPI0022241716|nr:TonB-dependent receptor [Sphingobium sp. B11D3D]MCW2368172.1 iron complex outermembrane receptor protein [Sphingobium sp. B11D3D]